MSEIAAFIFITQREKEIIHLLSKGYTALEIAERLFISKHTVISLRKKLIKKFVARNTVQMVLPAFQL